MTMYQGQGVFPQDEIRDPSSGNIFQYRNMGITVDDYMMIEFTKALLMSPYMPSTTHDELVKEAYKYMKAVLHRSSNPNAP